MTCQRLVANKFYYLYWIFAQPVFYNLRTSSLFFIQKNWVMYLNSCGLIKPLQDFKVLPLIKQFVRIFSASCIEVLAV
jgi:hypothetical protein